jgi:hypothetical protein
MCEKDKDSLCFWESVGDVYIHVCDDCMKKPKSRHDIIRICYETGKRVGIALSIEKLQDLK